MPVYKLDIIRPEHVKYNTLSVLNFEALACEHVGGVIGYGFDPDVAEQIVTVLNHVDPGDPSDSNWFSLASDEQHQEQFAAGLERRELDVLVRDGQVIGYTLRDNPASIYLILVLNGQHLMPYQKWHAEYKALQEE